MPWHYKHPNTFPPAYGAAIKVAAINLDEPQIFGSYQTKSLAENEAERIRYFKYCIRNTPSYYLNEILNNYDMRTSIEANGEFFFNLWLVVKPTKISDFVEHNPALAKEILQHL